jgi:hypothetical protein
VYRLEVLPKFLGLPGSRGRHDLLDGR